MYECLLLLYSRVFDWLLSVLGERFRVRRVFDFRSLRGCFERARMEVMQKLQQSMDPRMLQQMGGTQNVFNMMREIEKEDSKETGMGLKTAKTKKK